MMAQEVYLLTTINYQLFTLTRCASHYFQSLIVSLPARSDTTTFCLLRSFSLRTSAIGMVIARLPLPTLVSFRILLSLVFLLPMNQSYQELRN